MGRPIDLVATHVQHGHPGGVIPNDGLQQGALADPWVTGEEDRSAAAVPDSAQQGVQALSLCDAAYKWGLFQGLYVPECSYQRRANPPM